MNSDHLFVGLDDDLPENLRDRAIAYSRLPGGLQFLYDKLRDERSSTVDVVAVVEILVYYGEFDVSGDETIPLTTFPPYESLISSEQVSRAIQAYRDAPIKEVLLLACRKTVQRNLAIRAG